MTGVLIAAVAWYSYWLVQTVADILRVERWPVRMEYTHRVRQRHWDDIDFVLTWDTLKRF